MTKKALLKFALEKKLCEMSFYEFFQAAWIVVEPAVPLSTNWHHKYICDLLQEECERVIAQKPKTKDVILHTLQLYLLNLQLRVEILYLVIGLREDGEMYSILRKTRT